MINLDSENILVNSLRRWRGEIIAAPRRVRQRDKLQHRFGHRIDQIGGNFVVRERIADESTELRRIGPGGQRVVNRNHLAGGVSGLTKITRPLQGGRYVAGERHGLTLPDAFVVREKERPVLSVVADEGAKYFLWK